MKNEALRSYSHEQLTPTEPERKLVSAIYAAVCGILGEHRCRQIGSYPRFTAIRPPHDLDILFRAGFTRELRPDPATAITEVAKLLQDQFVAPAGLRHAIRVQSHSISITLFEGTDEKFGVDIVPGWETGEKNEFDDDIFRVPELILRGQRARQRKYDRVDEGVDSIDFILTDPLGYINLAKRVNVNEDFRRSTKCAKKWKHNSCEVNQEFKLKSFHIEQVFINYFDNSAGLAIYDALIRFFQELPNWISHGQIADRANVERNIDAYVDELTDAQRTAILDSAGEALERLRKFDGSGDVATLFAATPFAGRASSISGKAQAIIISNVSPKAPYGE